MKENKLYKTSEGAVLGGVLKGFSEVYNVDVALLRIAYVVIALAGVGSPILLYLIVWLILPDKQTVLAQKQEDDFSFDEDEYKI